MINTDTGAKKLEGTDNWRQIIPAHNDSVDAHDAAIANLQDGLAIVVDASQASHPSIAAGQFVFIKNHSTLADGLYTAKSAIGTTDALSTSNVQADAQGGLNALNSNISTIVAGTFTPNTQYIGGYNVRVVKIGRIAIAEGYFQPIANIPTGEMIGIMSFSNKTGLNHIFTACDTDANKAYSLYIENNSGIFKSNSITAIPQKTGAQYVTFATAYFTD